MRPETRASLEHVRAALAMTRFDPTLRQVLAELFFKEQAEAAAVAALEAAAAELERLEQEVQRRDTRIAELERRLDDLDEPARVRTMSGEPHRVLEWETVEASPTAGANEH